MVVKWCLPDASSCYGWWLQSCALKRLDGPIGRALAAPSALRAIREERRMRRRLHNHSTRSTRPLTVVVSRMQQRLNVRAMRTSRRLDPICHYRTKQNPNYSSYILLRSKSSFVCCAPPKKQADRHSGTSCRRFQSEKDSSSS